MATDTAAAPSADTHTTDPTRHLWQLPALLIGAGVFVAAWQGWLPVGRSDPASAFVRDVDALKAAYEKLTPDPTDLKARLSAVAAGVEAYPEHAAVARFHLGSGYVRLAELTPAADEARGYWTLARQHFERADGKQLGDPADPPRLAFRAAKARAALGLAPDAPPADVTLLVTVLSVPPPGEEGGETKRLVADLALRQTPPDLALAKLSLGDYLKGAGIATPPAALARARLRLGQIHLRAREYDEARRWLAQVNADAPPEVLAPAKAELARVLMANGDYVGAAKELDILRAAPGVPPQYRTGAAYDLAVCKLKTREPEAATRFFEEAAKGAGPEATAAAVQLAELHLRAADPARHPLAVDLLAGAVKGVKTPSGFKNELVPVGDVQGAFELAVTTLLADGAFEPALRAADAYAAVSAAGRDRERRADVLAAWGAKLKKDGGDAKPKLRDAADEFAALAAFQPKTDGKLDMLRRAAALYRQADEPAAAVTRLKEAIKLPDIPDAVAGPLWVELADALLAAKQLDQVWPAFNEIMAAGGVTSTATRYRLARQFVDSRHEGLVPVGRGLFEQIAKQQTVAPDEREFHERALTELANDLIRQGNFADAESRLRSQLKTYPDGPEAQLAGLLLGVCLLQRAAAPNAPDAQKMRTEAVEVFKEIVTACDEAARRAGKASEREAWLRRQAALRVLQTYQQMKTPQAANALLAEAAPLLDRQKGTVEELIVLSLVYHAFKQLNEPGKALQTRDRMKDVFDKLAPSAFPQKDGEYSRDYWQTVWFAPDPK